VTGPDNWLMAVHLKAGIQALDFLDPLSDRGKIATFKDLHLNAQDVRNRLWQVHSGSAHVFTKCKYQQQQQREVFCAFRRARKDSKGHIATRCRTEL
jgi:hypothetical protein